MERLVVIGCGGSGKTYLARKLGARLGLPVTHLDTLFYDHNWNPLSPERFAERQRELVAAPRWIIDGNYAATLPIRLARADTVLFLDLPARTCLRAILQRHRRYGGGQHDTSGVYNRITRSFVRYILNYRRKMRPRVHRLLADHAGHADVAVLRSRRAVRRYPAYAVARTGESGRHHVGEFT